MMAIGVFGIISIFLMLCNKIKILKCNIYFTWCIVGWFTLIGFIVTTALFTASIVSYDACQVLE
jgi:hypothetical protein